MTFADHSVSARAVGNRPIVNCRVCELWEQARAQCPIDGGRGVDIDGEAASSRVCSRSAAA